MTNSPKYVTESDFFNYWGTSLNSLLKDNSNISNKCNIFLRMAEARIMAWVDSHTFRVKKWEDLEGEELENFQRAILEQTMYIFRNSDIALDSGYDPEKGVIASKKVLDSITVPQVVIDYLINAGLYNHTINNRFRRIRNLF